MVVRSWNDVTSVAIDQSEERDLNVRGLLNVTEVTEYTAYLFVQISANFQPIRNSTEVDRIILD